MQKEPEASRQNLEEIGELLFELLTADISEAQRQMGWVIFERKLRLYYSKRKNMDSRFRGNDPDEISLACGRTLHGGKLRHREIKNPKFEARNPKQYLIIKIQMFKTT